MQKNLPLSILCASALFLSGCGTISGLDQLSKVSLQPSQLEATPPILGIFEEGALISTPTDWQDRRAPILRNAIQRDLYGFQPDMVEIVNTITEQVSNNAYGGIATLELVTLTVQFSFNGGSKMERDIRLAIAKPKNAVGPLPVILKMDTCPFNEGFQDNSLPDGKSKFQLPIAAIPPEDLPNPLPEEMIGVESIEAVGNATCKGQGSGVFGRVVKYSLGRYHYTPPVKEAVEQGYAFAAINIVDFLFDSNHIAAAQLELMSKGAPTGKAWGSLAAWAFQYSRGIDYLETDPTLDSDRMAIYGHSRFGKATLIAGALDPRIDAIIAHQSGRGGSALFADENGEPIKEMIESYPQWLSQSFNDRVMRNEALPFDQHHLLALLAPRPVLLGHGRRDGWADPDGSFRAAKGASPVYELFGKPALTANNLSDFDPNANIAFWMRPGTHGETKEDWEAFFEFLNIHFQP